MDNPAAQTFARWQFGVCLGCGTFILATFLVLAWTVYWGDKTFTQDPAQVEGHLQAVLPCEVPHGYRGFQGAHVPGGQRIAVLVPSTFAKERLDVRLPLIVSLWTRSSREEVAAYWTAISEDRLGGTVQTTPAQAPELTLRGQPLADVAAVALTKDDVRLLLVTAPVQGSEPAWLSLLGEADSFDLSAAQALLSSVK